MKADEVRDFLRQHRVEFKESEIQDAIQFRCASGEVINAFHSGRVVVQGRKTELTKALAERSGDVAIPVVPAMRSRQEAPTKEDPSKRIFIVYGHDLAARDGLELVVRRMGLDPMFWRTCQLVATPSSRNWRRISENTAMSDSRAYC